MIYSAINSSANMGLGIIFGSLILILGIVIALSNLYKADVESGTWKRTIAKALEDCTYNERGGMRSGKASIERHELKISYSVDGKEYIKYIPLRSGSKVAIFYKVSNPNYFMLENEYREKFSHNTSRESKDNSKSIFTTIIGIILFFLGIFIMAFSR